MDGLESDSVPVSVHEFDIERPVRMDMNNCAGIAGFQAVIGEIAKKCDSF
jgi:hypothetical protein